jgi:hypothetical protein
MGEAEVRLSADGGSIAAPGARESVVSGRSARSTKRRPDAKNDTIVPVQSILDCVALIWKCPAAPRQRADHLSATAAD